MDAKQITTILDHPTSRELLARNVTRLAYVAADGTPRVVPLGFAWDGSAVIMLTTPNAPKYRALRRAPAVSLTIDTEDYPPRILLIRGRAELELLDGVPEDYRTTTQARELTAEEQREWESAVDSLYSTMVRIVVRPTWVKLIDFEDTFPSALAELMEDRERRAAHESAG